MGAPGKLSTEEAVLRLRADPARAGLVRDSYLGADVLEAARRFAASAEFVESCHLAGGVRPGMRVLDVGAGRGVASYAFACLGARVVALEPDPSPVVGQGSIRELPGALDIDVVGAYSEALPLRDASFDLVYARQVLHHTRDLPLALRECARVLRPGGRFLATREHVVDDEAQLAEFLAAHPVHQLAGGENAYSLPAYRGAVAAVLRPTAVLGPWESIVNAFPEVSSEEEMRGRGQRWLEWKYGRPLGMLLGRLPACQAHAVRKLSRHAGRLFTFAAVKP